MKTPEEILINNCHVFSSLFHDTSNKASVMMKESILKSMEEYAQSKAREMVLEYARWYEENSVPDERQNADWMIKENVKSFYDARL